MTMHSVNWNRLGFIQLVNNVLSVITFMVSITLAILFGWQWFFGAFLALSLLVAICYRIAFGFSTCYAYYLWVRRGHAAMAEYVARTMNIIEEVEISDDFPSGIAKILGLNNTALASAKEVNVGLHS